MRLAFGESGDADQSGAPATMAAAVIGKRSDITEPSALDRLKSAGVAIADAACVHRVAVRIGQRAAQQVNRTPDRAHG